MLVQLNSPLLFIDYAAAIVAHYFLFILVKSIFRSLGVRWRTRLVCSIIEIRELAFLNRANFSIVYVDVINRRASRLLQGRLNRITTINEQSIIVRIRITYSRYSKQFDQRYHLLLSLVLHLTPKS